MTTISKDISPSDFLTAMNANFDLLAAACSPSVATSEYTVITNLLEGADLINALNANFQVFAQVAQLTGSVLSVGERGKLYIDTINTNFSSILAAINQWESLLDWRTKSNFTDLVTYASTLPTGQADTIIELGSVTGRYTGGVLAPNGMIYAAPHLGATTILKINTVNNTVSQFGTVSADGYSGGVLAPNGCIYFVPYLSGKILKIDPSDDSYSELSSGHGRCGGAILAPNGKIYGMPFTNTHAILKIDPTNDDITEFGNVDIPCAGGVLTPNGMIYGVPYGTTTVMKLNPVTEEITSFQIGAAHGYVGGALSFAGNIYCVSVNSGDVLKIDPLDDSSSIIGQSTLLCVGCVLGTNGMIYGIRNSAAGSKQVLKINPVTDSITDIGTITGYYEGGILAMNGCIYFIPVPAISGSVTAILTKYHITPSFALNRFMNKF